MTSTPLTPGSPLSRRAFLALGGAALAGALLPTGLAAAAQPLRIGVLLARSDRHPELAERLLAGMRLAIARAGGLAGGRPVDLRVVAYEARPAAGLRALGGLLHADRVDAVIGLASSGSARELHAALAERRVPMLLTDVGANLLRGPAERPYLFRSSLAGWQSSYAAGAWAAGSLGRRAAVVSSFYESGYDLPAAFRLGFEGAGGQIRGVYVTHTPDGRGRPEAALRAAAAGRPELIYLLSSGRPAAELADALARSPLAGQVPVVAGAFALAGSSPALDGAFSALPWADDHPAPAAPAFRAAFRAAAGAPPDPLAALGHDSMALLLSAADAAGGRADRLAEALAAASVEGARGPLTIGAGGEAAGPIYLRRAALGPAGLTQHSLATLAQPGPADVAALAEGRRSGWANAYLAV